MNIFTLQWHSRMQKIGNHSPWMNKLRFEPQHCYLNVLHWENSISETNPHENSKTKTK